MKDHHKVLAIAVCGLAVLRLGGKRRRPTVTATKQQGMVKEHRSCDGTAAKGQPLDPRFFARRDTEGNLRLSTRFIDTFLRWECGRYLLGLGLFPNVQEITESMACFEAIREHLPFVSLSDPDVCAVVVGDGRTPRTAALLALRTKWQVVSVDPALHGLQTPPQAGVGISRDQPRSPLSGAADPSAVADDPAQLTPASPSDNACSESAEVCYKTLPKELRHERLQSQEQTVVSKVCHASP